jgi:hypothetical protein
VEGRIMEEVTSLEEEVTSLEEEVTSLEEDYVNGLTVMEILVENGVIQKRIVLSVVVHGVHKPKIN